ncbi:SEC-C metal-binding domain-containing protein [Staphylococcus xylosus]
MSSVMRTERNDPCPCNSGKKYKKCCLLRQMKQNLQKRLFILLNQ